MLIIKADTAKGRKLLESAKVNKGESLHEVYGRYSQAKENAYNYCKELCYKENGSNFHICSSNTSQFSVVWEVADGIRIETAKNSYFVETIIALEDMPFDKMM